MSTAPLLSCSTLARGASSPIPTAAEPGNNSLKTAQGGTFGDIDPNYNLSNAQYRAIELALEGNRWSQIARILSISRKTLWRWKSQDFDFQLALAGARADRYDFAAERCQTIASRATSVLAKFLEDSADKNRMRAAQLLLQAAARFKPPETRRAYPDYPASPLVTPPPPADEPEPDLEPKVG